jgi:hypothetical protein
MHLIRTYMVWELWRLHNSFENTLSKLIINFSHLGIFTINIPKKDNLTKKELQRTILYFYYIYYFMIIDSPPNSLLDSKEYNYVKERK